MFNTKPYITLCKEDETAFVNARTYWSVSGTVGATPEHRTYELRVKHGYPEDVFSFWFLNRGEHDDLELQTEEAFEARRHTIAENEPQECERHAAMSEDERDAEIDRLAEKVALPPNGEFAWLCKDCKAASLNRADALLADRARAMNKSEERFLAELKRHWEALLLLFNPTTNL